MTIRPVLYGDTRDSPAVRRAPVAGDCRRTASARLPVAWTVGCSGALFMLFGAVRTNLLPAAFFGIPERFSVFAAALFNAALGVALFRDFR